MSIVSKLIMNHGQTKMSNLYLAQQICQIMHERGLKSETDMWWKIADDQFHQDTSNRPPEYSLSVSGQIPAYTIFSILLPENAKKWWKKWWGEEHKITRLPNGDEYCEKCTQQSEDWPLTPRWQYHSHQYLDLIQSGADIKALEKYLEETKG